MIGPSRSCTTSGGNGGQGDKEGRPSPSYTLLMLLQAHDDAEPKHRAHAARIIPNTER
jgi:hypothetical protein